jgi:hypothetical protein
MSLPTPQQLPGAAAERFSGTVIAHAEANARAAMTAVERGRRLMVAMYVLLFVVGLGTAVTAVVCAFAATGMDDALATIGVAGLSATSFLALFIARPLESLERNAIYSQWLAATVTTYWTRLAYFSDIGTVDADITAATRKLTTDLEQLATRHAAALGQVPVPQAPN